MKKIAAVLFLLLTAIPAFAQTPWPTPTPYPYDPQNPVSTPAIDLSGYEYTLAENVVSGYQYFNATGYMDLFFFVLLLFLLLFMARDIMEDWKDL